MKEKAKLLILALALLLALAPAVMAQVQMRPVTDPIGKLGPINTYDPAVTPTGNGFPLYVEDVNNVKLDLPVPPYGDGVTAPTLIYDPKIPENALSMASGFGPEAFFYLAESIVNLPNGGKALLVLGIEAAYGAEDPMPGDQFLFARVRVRFDAAAAGTYTVRHPWGVETLEVTAADVGTRFSHTYDWGGFAPVCPDQISCITDAVGTPLAPAGFDRLLLSPKDWVFLEAELKNVQNLNNPAGDEKTWIIGDGVTPTALKATNFKGVPVYTRFTINGPADATGIGPVFADSGEFTVSGHFFTKDIPTTAGTTEPPQQLVADTVTITRTRLRSNTVEVRATSSNGFPMTGELYVGGVGGTLVGSANLGTSGRGNISFTATPDTVKVHSTSTNPAILGGSASAAIQ